MSRLIQTKIRIYSDILANSKPKEILLRIFSKFIAETEYFYTTNTDQVSSDSFEITIPALKELLAFYQTNLFLTPAELERYQQAYSAGKRKPFVLKLNGKICTVAWLEKSLKNDIPPKLQSSVENVYSIVDCFTSKDHRGKGLYQKMLKNLCNKVASDQILIIYTHNWNYASQRGILKSGFKKIATRVQLKFMRLTHWY